MRVAKFDRPMPVAESAKHTAAEAWSHKTQVLIRPHRKEYRAILTVLILPTTRRVSS
jgi:hypothetical protein